MSNEVSVLDALLNAANYQTQTIKIEIHRGDKDEHGKPTPTLTFRVHALTEAQYQHAKKQHTTYTKIKRAGNLPLPSDVDTARYNSAIIYTATVDEDRAIWDNQVAWEKLNATNALDLIDEVLKAGEKDEVVRKIDELSGFDDLEEVANK